MNKFCLIHSIEYYSLTTSQNNYAEWKKSVHSLPEYTYTAWFHVFKFWKSTNQCQKADLFLPIDRGRHKEARGNLGDMNMLLYQSVCWAQCIYVLICEYITKLKLYTLKTIYQLSLNKAMEKNKNLKKLISRIDQRKKNQWAEGSSQGILQHWTKQ